jgi:peptide methionine sulfoxide reductase msrA/msrB
MKIILLLGFAILIGSVLLGVQHSKSQEQDMTDEMDKEINEKNAEKATFAGGCFWCTESDFEKIDGVLAVVSGYTGGDEENPTYEQVSYGRTGHYEAVQVLYDSEKITYSELLGR